LQVQKLDFTETSKISALRGTQRARSIDFLGLGRLAAGKSMLRFHRLARMVTMADGQRRRSVSRSASRRNSSSEIAALLAHSAPLRAGQQARFRYASR